MLAAAVAILLADPAQAVADPAAFVNPLAGSRPGAKTFRGGHTFPGAAMPFGMVQFSPDTEPQGGSDGYDRRDSRTRGFSLTHLSGAGCPLYADFPILPTTQPLDASPASAGSDDLAPQFRPQLQHRSEIARPGLYAVKLGDGARMIDARLTSSTRSGLARFEFPRGGPASVVINVGGSANPDDHADVQIDPSASEIAGSASSGYFCSQRPRYRIYFAARFDRPFAAFGTWQRQSLSPGATAATDDARVSHNGSSSAQAGAYATFDAAQARDVQVKVGVSFVSVEGARHNLAAEQQGFSFGRVAAQARQTWNRALATIKVSGGRHRDIDTFYTALYHAMLAPRTFNDVDGAYEGMDGQVHSIGAGTKYADISGWDIYRTQIPLLAMTMPARASGIVRSLLIDAAESGCLPRWPYANGQSMTQVGDPSDPIIASAAAFGARAFDVRAALAAMVKGATQPCQSANGSYLERQGLSTYLDLGYLPIEIDSGMRNPNSLFGTPDAVWGSAATTLEYQAADFAIAQFAGRFAHDARTSSLFLKRSGNWRKLFNPHSRFIEPRHASGAFPSGYDIAHGPGFVEGSAAQYTWAVPFDLHGLERKLGGSRAASRRLTYFLRILNSPHGTGTNHAQLGNEPTLLTPWLFDWFGRPYETQATLRRALGLYRPTPAGYPGNDDLGTLSSWYVLSALGIYPAIPGTGVLALSSPLFSHARLRLGGRAVRIDARAAPRSLFVRSLRINGRRHAKPWTTYCALARGARLAFTLGRRPNLHWGARAAPPSYPPGSPAPAGACGR